MQDNEILKTIKERVSVRKFKPEMVSREEIDKILEAGVWSASGMNSQSPLFIAITDKETRDKLSAMNAAVMNFDQDPFYGAPVVIAVLSDKNAHTYIYDGSIAIGNMMLAAYSMGIGCCWIHRAKEEFESEEGKAILKSLGIEGEYEGIGHLILGYPEGDASAVKERKEGRVYYID